MKTYTFKAHDPNTGKNTTVTIRAASVADSASRFSRILADYGLLAGEAETVAEKVEKQIAIAERQRDLAESRGDYSAMIRNQERADDLRDQYREIL